MQPYISKTVRALAGIAIPLSLVVTAGPADVLLEPVPAIMVFVPVLIATICLRIGAGQHWARSFLALGVPTGLLGTTLGLVKIVVGVSGSVTENAVSALAETLMAECLIPLLYGGLISAIGFAALTPENVAMTRRVSPLWWSAPLVFTLLFITSIAWLHHLPIGPFLRGDVPIVTIACIATFLSFRSDTSSIIRWSEAALFSSIICVGIGILKWFHNSDNGTDNIKNLVADTDAITFALVGVFYGCALYVGAYFFSFRQGNTVFADAPRMNWHFLEVNAFLYFLTIAPPSFPDLLRNIESNKQIVIEQRTIAERMTALEDKFEQLSQK
jgi:hypothetical protein